MFASHGEEGTYGVLLKESCAGEARAGPVFDLKLLGPNLQQVGRTSYLLESVTHFNTPDACEPFKFYATIMQLLRSILLIASAALSVAAAESSKYPKSITLSYEVIGSSSSPKQLAEVLYDPATLKNHLSSWTPPTADTLKSTTFEPTSSQLVRVLLPDGSSTITSLGAFDSALSQDINIWLSPGSDGNILSASVSSISPPPLSEEEQRQKRKEERAKAKGKPIPKPTPKPKSKPKKGAKVEEERTPGPVVQVNLIRAAEGIQPKLLSRAPPKVDSEGREVAQEDVPEKSFFQKYWWVFLVGTVLLMGGGGGDK